MFPEAGSPLVPFGRPERVGTIVAPFDPIVGGPRFSNAGNSFPLNPDPNQPGASLSATFLDLACQDASFMAGVVNTVRTDIANFVANQAAPIGSTIATIAVVSSPGLLATLLALIPILITCLALLEAFLTALQNDPQPKLGQALNDLRKALLTRGLLVFSHGRASRTQFSPNNKVSRLSRVSAMLLSTAGTTLIAVALSTWIRSRYFSMQPTRC